MRDARIRSRRDRRPTSIWRIIAPRRRTSSARWKLARASYFLGTQGPAAERRMWLETGLAAATDAVALNDARPEGHFWLAANMGALAESYGLRQGLKYRTRIKQALERVLAIDPAVHGRLGRPRPRAVVPQGAGPVRRQRRQGRTAPPQVAHLQPAVHGEPVLPWRALRRPGPARPGLRLYQQVLEAPIHRDYVAEDKFYKAQARARLQTLSVKR